VAKGTSGKFAAGVSDTGDAPWAGISPSISKKFEKALVVYSGGLGGTWFMKKTWSRKSHGTVPSTLTWMLIKKCKACPPK
jgi:hypothetical protein